ncbi:MAG: AMP-binding protein [Opitutaceae bacterium]
MERAELIQLLRVTGCAEERGDFTFLCDPAWSSVDRANVKALQESKVGKPSSAIPHGWLCIPTGGSSGSVRFARHDEHTLTAAVQGFCAHFGFEQVNAVDVLPAHHVSGLMARVRCAATGGEHVVWEWKRLEAGERPMLDQRRGSWVISLVPTQLQRLLASADTVAWLRDFSVIFIGGGPVWPELTEAAAKSQLPISLSYGMTETAAMVAALRPAEFLAGDRSSGSALPHARISIEAEGAIQIAGDSIFRGYFPEERTARVFVTEDIGRLDERGQLHVLGRRDAVIITGGEKVQPMEVEAALRASGEFSDVVVVSLPDAEWGQIVVACYALGTQPPDWARVSAALMGLAAFKRPKRFVAVASWPRNAQGKINRTALAAAARQKREA